MMRTKEKEKLIQLLGGLVGEYPLNQDEMGGCVWCGGSGKEGTYGYCTEEYDCHQGDCPWVRGHQYLQQLKNV